MLDDLILNLTTLGKLRQDDKLTVYYGRLYIDPYTFGRSMKRKITGQNRYDVLTFISTTSNYALAYRKSIVNRVIDKDDSNIDVLEPLKREELVNLYQAFVLALGGLDELKNTYVDDRSAISSIDVVINNIAKFCRRLSYHWCASLLSFNSNIYTCSLWKLI